MMRKRYNWCLMTLFIAYLFLLAFLCYFKPSSEIDVPKEIFGLMFDKVVHFLMFFPFVILGTLACKRNNYWKAMVFIVLLAVISAFTLELFQSVLTDYRTTDPWDLISNITAITVSTAAMTVYGLLKKK